MRELLNNYIGSVCEVCTMENEILFSGRIRQVLETDDKKDGIALELVAAGGEALPVVPYGLKMKMHVFHKTHGLLALGGQIYIANSNLWRINSVTQYGNTERRAFFRVKVNGRGAVCGCSPAEGSARPACPGQNTEIRVSSISLAGLLFEADESFSIGDILQLETVRFGEDFPSFHLCCCVCRIDLETGTKPQYGCRFENLEEKTADQLYSAIFELQRREIARRRKRL
ncbi:PilZ domain-containing protein [Acidaminobacterium chupaoyuni]